MDNETKTFNNKTLLVCGGAGFIGSNFTRYILEKYPKAVIINYDKLTYSGNIDNIREHSDNPRHIFVQGDVADDQRLRSVFAVYKPDYVINFAAETHVDRSIHVGAKEFILTNILGVYNILETVKTAGYVQKYVQVSTDEVYGSLALDSTERFHEKTPNAPSVPYAATKAGGDQLCHAYFKTWQVPVVVTHCSNNYGPYQYPEKLIPFFIVRMLEGQKLPIYGDGKHVRDWIYVLDHCRALELCLLNGTAGEKYHIGADNEINNLDIAARILQRFGRDSSWLEFVAERPGHDRRYAIDSAKIRKELGWEPSYSFELAFDETINWYLNNTAWIEQVRQRTGVFNPHIDLWKTHDLKI